MARWRIGQRVCLKCGVHKQEVNNSGTRSMTLWETIHPEPRRFPRPHKSSPLRPFLPDTPPPSNQPHFPSRGKIYLGASAVRQHTHFNQTPHLTRIYHFYLSKSNPCHLLQNHQVVKTSTPSSNVHVHHMVPTACNPFYTANKTNGSHT